MKTLKGLGERIIMLMTREDTFYAAKVSKISKSNQSHVLRVISELKKEGIVKVSEKSFNNRTILLELTDKGKEIGKLLNKLKGVLTWK